MWLFPAIFLMFGCEVLLLMEPDGDGNAGTANIKLDPDDSSGPDDIEVPDEFASAYFILHASDTRTPEWPEAYRDYDVLVCSAGISSTDFQTIRAGLPGATLLASTNLQDMFFGPPSNPYYQELRAVFDSTLCITDLHTGNVVRVFGWDPDIPGSGIPGWIVGQESAEILAKFHRDVTMPTGWDGLYIDNCTRVVPNWRKNIVNTQTDSFDVDSDGVADTWAEVDALYATWRPFFTEHLRVLLGSTAVLVGNAGGPLGDFSLNGICLESVGSRFTVPQARQYFGDQHVVSRSPKTNIAWVIHPEDLAPTISLAQEIPALWVGDVTY